MKDRARFPGAAVENDLSDGLGVSWVLSKAYAALALLRGLVVSNCGGDVYGNGFPSGESQGDGSRTPDSAVLAHFECATFGPCQFDSPGFRRD